MTEPADGNRMLARVASILDAVDGSAASASELARRAGLSVSTAHRIAVSMVEYGFLRRTANGDFGLGHRFVRSVMATAALPVLSQLRDETGETAQLWIRRADERVCLVTVDSKQELKVSMAAGSRLPLPAGSSGRILSGDEEALSEIAVHGWVDSMAKRTSGQASVSAPVFLEGQLVASVCLALPLSRVTSSPGLEFGASVVAAAATISTLLDKAQTA